MVFSVSWRPRAVLVWVPGLSRSVPRGAVFCFAAPNGPQPGEILSRSASQMPVVRFVASKQAWTGKSVWRSASREPAVRFADSSLRGTVCVTRRLSSRHQLPSQDPSRGFRLLRPLNGVQKPHDERRIADPDKPARSTGPARYEAAWSVHPLS